VQHRANQRWLRKFSHGGVFALVTVFSFHVFFSFKTFFRGTSTQVFRVSCHITGSCLICFTLIRHPPHHLHIFRNRDGLDHGNHGQTSTDGDVSFPTKPMLAILLFRHLPR
jgi:hypothetical protein